MKTAAGTSGTCETGDFFRGARMNTPRKRSAWPLFVFFRRERMHLPGYSGLYGYGRNEGQSF